jgi:uncharacterized iron-regulated protein
MKIIFIKLITATAITASSIQIATAQIAPKTLAADTAAISYAAHRVYDTRYKRFTDFESLLADATTADVLFLGEQHDDPVTHALETAALAGLTRRRGNIVLAMEMFERDAQPALDGYLGERVSESDFLAASRPWPRYRSDYRPIVEFAKRYHWPVIASNVPRRFASLVARRGLAGINDSVPSAERAYVARTFQCPHDDYFERFASTMGDMSGHGAPAKAQTEQEKKATLERVYQAQCVKDETMGESIAIAYAAAPPRALVVHVNGSFHSDYRLGTAERTQRQLPGKRILVVSFVPIADLDAADGAAQKKIGDYVIFTLAPPKSSPAP